MYKMDGRLKPASNLEKASFKNRIFECKKCSRRIIVTKVEFAKEVVCDICGECMHEVIEQTQER